MVLAVQARDPVDGELLEFNPITGQQVATITLPTRSVQLFGYYYPYGFQHRCRWGVPADRAQPNSENIIHLDASYNEINSYAAAGMTPGVPRSRSGRQRVYFTGLNGPDGTAIC